MKYQNKRNGKVATVIDQDERGVLTLQYEDGSTQQITESTRKRWFKPVLEDQNSVENLIDDDNHVTEEEAEQLGLIGGDEALERAVVDPEDAYVAEAMRQEQQLGIDCPPTTEAKTIDEDTCADGTPYSEVGKEIAEQAKEKAEVQKSRKPKKVKSRRVSNPEVAQIVAYIEGKVTELGGKIFTPDKAPKVRLFKVNDHMFARINISGSHVSLCCRSCAVDLDSLGCVPDKTQNHMFDAIYIFEDLSKTTLIDSIIDQSFGYQKEKNTLKKTKKEEK